MKLAYRSNIPRYPLSWSELPAGEATRAAVEIACNEFSQRIFGYHFVKLGNLSTEIGLSKCAVSHHIHQSRVQNEYTGIVSESTELPFVENSIDGFLLANELDFSHDPHQILREVDRCITQNGYVIISGFNPYSLTGIGKYLPVKWGNVLHDARFFSSARVQDWLELLGFEIVAEQNLLFSMLFYRLNRRLPSKWHDRLSRYLPWCSSVYVILAKKRTWPMTTIKPKWKLKPRFSAVGASMRVNRDSPVK